MPRHFRRTAPRSALAALLFAVPTLAQIPQRGPDHGPTEPARATAEGVALAGATRGFPETAALELRDDTLWAHGRAFKARFLQGGLEFTPALVEAPGSMPVTFGFDRVHRGGPALPTESPSRSHAGLRVEYDRGAVTERYDVSAAGIEQSFVLRELPLGTGDLVVEVGLTTALTVAPRGDGLGLELADVGGLTIGGVTGIDANGDRVAGSLHYDRGTLELRLPAAFVDRAALPLTIDPLIGNVFAAYTSNFNDRDPDVAYDATTNTYLVVFERRFSATDTDIHGQRVSSSGGLLGGRVYIQTASTNEYDPVVANVNVRDHFVVVYTRANDIVARSVDASDGTVHLQHDIAVGSDVEWAPDVAGEATTVDDEAVCVWWNQTTNSIMAKQITVGTTGQLGSFGLTTLYQSNSITPRFPRISKSGGDLGILCVAFERQYSTSNRNPAICLIDRNIGIRHGLLPLSSSSLDQISIDVDGNGWQFVVAWQTEESASSTKYDIDCRTLTYVPVRPTGSQAQVTSNIVRVHGDQNDHEFGPKVIMAGNSAVLGWSDESGSEYHCYLASIDPANCTFCEGTTLGWLQGPLRWSWNLQGCSKASGGSTAADDMLLVMEDYDYQGTAGSNILAQRWHCEDGEAHNLGGSCGPGHGSQFTFCPHQGRSAFEARLYSRKASYPAWLVVSRDFFGLPCGTGQMVPDPFHGLVVADVTDTYGRAVFAAPIPNSSSVVGVQLYAQWVIYEPVAPGCPLFSSDLSDALRVIVE